MLGLRSKTIIAILLVILTISIIYLSFFIRQRNENQQSMIDCKKDLVATLVATLTREIDKQYSARIQSFAMTRREIIKFFAEHDPEGLRRAAQPVYRILKDENRFFDHIDFVRPDDTVFLSIGDPEGDEPLCQLNMKEGTHPGRLSSGFVYDTRGLLYRIVQPIYYQERFVGNVIFEIQMGAFIEDIRKSLTMHTGFALRSDLLDRENPDPHQKAAAGKYTLIDFGDSFFRAQAAAISLDGKQKAIRYGKDYYYIFPSYTIKDSADNEIGTILQGVQVNELVDLYYRDVIGLAAITFIVLVAASLILYLAFTKLYSHLVALNRELNGKNEELREASRRLEKEVAGRTEELSEANERLQKEINQRHEINKSLSRSIEEWQSTFDAIADPVTILDKDLEVVIANRAAHQMLCKDYREIVGRTCHELFAGSSEICDSCPAKDVFSKGVHQDYEVEHDYLGRSLMVSCAPIYEGKEVMGYVNTAKDITQEKALKKQLSQAQKMEAIATLAGGIAHDFNNILGAILGNADLLLFRLTSKGSDGERLSTVLRVEDVENHVQAIKKAGNRAKELVSQILAFSRQGKTKRQNAIITPVIKEAIKLLRSSLLANIEISSDIAPDLCHIYADLTQIHQVFMNLCTNAAQAMHEKGGILSVSVKVMEAGTADRKEYPDLKPGRYIALVVQDTGHGMTPQVMERIFDPFFTTRDVGEGTGMGLAVIHEIISSHDGVLDVKSTVNEGSTFTVFFPCVDDAHGHSEDVILGMPCGHEKVLFVDDEEDILRMTARMLEYLGYTVYTTSSADTALAMLEKDTFGVDLVITDYSMPGISGIELAQKIGTMRPGLPVMLCSGFSESVVFDGATRRSVSKFMSKPLDMKKLAAAIREIMPHQAGE